MMKKGAKGTSSQASGGAPELLIIRIYSVIHNILIYRQVRAIKQNRYACVQKVLKMKRAALLNGYKCSNRLNVRKMFYFNVSESTFYILYFSDRKCSF